MRVENAAEWSLTRKALHKSPGPDFLKYLDFWSDTADTMVEEQELSPHEALGQALKATESEVGSIYLDFYALALALICTHWVCGTEVVQSMSPLEMKVITTALQDIAARQQDAARQH